MIEKLEVRTVQGDLLILPLDAETGYIVEDIDGLDPVKSTLVSSSFANQAGATYQSSKREVRNILLKLAFEPVWSINQTVRDLRKQLYRIFETESELNLRFYLSDGPSVEIGARKEDITAPLFVADPKATISLLCFEPDFIVPTPVVLSGNTVSTTTETNVTYDGDIETGIKFTLNVNRSVSEVTIYHRGPDGVVRSLEFAAALVAGDVLTISTVRGSKGATLLRTGVTSSVLFAVSAQSNWIALDTGLNTIRVYAEGAGIPYTIEYITRYGGL